MNKIIYLVAPSFGCTTEPYKSKLKEAIKNLKQLGFHIIEGENIYKSDCSLASTSPKARALEIVEAFKSEADIIMSVGGGEMMCEILPFLDFSLLKQFNKVFVGFSDNTNLTFTLTTINDQVTIYGPNAPSFYHLPFRYHTLDLIKMLKGKTSFKGYKKWEKESLVDEDHPLAPLNLKKDKVIVSYNYEKPFTGVMLGGCLDCLITLCGTKYDHVKEYIKKHKNIIWYLEACDLNPLSIKRALFQLREAGWFNTASGFLIGRPLCDDLEIMGLNKYEAVTDILSVFNKPILMDVDLGHYPPSMPIYNGKKAIVKLDNINNIHIIYKK